MKTGYLSEYFSGVIVKKLADVEVDSAISHQHEFNANKAMKHLFGLERRT